MNCIKLIKATTCYDALTARAHFCKKNNHENRVIDICVFFLFEIINSSQQWWAHTQLMRKTFPWNHLLCTYPINPFSELYTHTQFESIISVWVNECCKGIANTCTNHNLGSYNIYIAYFCSFIPKSCWNPNSQIKQNISYEFTYTHPVS